MATNYEVQSFAEERWQTAEIAQNKEEAVARAKAIADAGACEKVRVLETASDRSGKSLEQTVFEQAATLKGPKPITAQSVDVVPMCQAPSDMFRLEARLAIGRVLRDYLDEANATVSDLITDPGQISQLSRHETMLPQAIGIIASLQARTAEFSQKERTDALYRLVDGVRDIATTVAKESANLARTLAEQGLNEFAANLKSQPESLWKPLQVAGMAAYLREEGDPASRIEKLLTLSDHGDTLSTFGQGVIDEALAEIFDGGETVKSVIGPMPDLASATLRVCALGRGQLTIEKSGPKIQEQLNTFLRTHSLPAAKASIHRWVSTAMASLQPLTREGGEAERSAFTEVLGAMLQDDGLAGGAKTSEAVTQRARSTLVTDPYDQRTEDAIDALLHSIPAKSTRVGYLADVASTETVGKRAGPAIVERLVETMGGVRSLGDLSPPGTTRKESEAIQNKLIEKIERAPLPQELRQHLSSKISSLPAGAGRPVMGFQNVQKPGDKIRNYAAGEKVFAEGDLGDEAYMVRKGAVEIRIGVEGKEIAIATLGPGEIFGEMSLIDDQPRAAAAYAKSDAEVLIVRSAPFKKRLDALDENDPVLRHLIDIYVTRLRLTVKKLN